jgi:hypothetical protein
MEAINLSRSAQRILSNYTAKTVVVDYINLYHNFFNFFFGSFFGFLFIDVKELGSLYLLLKSNKRKSDLKKSIKKIIQAEKSMHWQNFYHK